MFLEQQNIKIIKAAKKMGLYFLIAGYFRFI
jgi:hypothetical protein